MGGPIGQQLFRLTDRGVDNERLGGISDDQERLALMIGQKAAARIDLERVDRIPCPSPADAAGSEEDGKTDDSQNRS